MARVSLFESPKSKQITTANSLLAELRKLSEAWWKGFAWLSIKSAEAAARDEEVDIEIAIKLDRWRQKSDIPVQKIMDELKPLVSRFDIDEAFYTGREKEMKAALTPEALALLARVRLARREAA